MATPCIDGIVSNIETKREKTGRFDILTITYAGNTSEDQHQELRVKISHEENPFIMNDYIRVHPGKPTILERTTDTGKTIERYMTAEPDAA